MVSTAQMAAKTTRTEPGPFFVVLAPEWTSLTLPK